MSQLVDRLRHELDRLEDPLERAEVIARLACALARMGRFDDARQAIVELRHHFGRGESGRATVWIMLAEGLVHHYEELDPAAMDRITRAQLLGSAMNYSKVVALASAWRAHIEFEHSDFPAMIRSLELVIKTIAIDEYDAQTRLSMVLANAFMICGESKLAQVWFTKGRDCALRNGDQASIEALLYNRAAFSLAWLRALNCVVSVDHADLVRVRSEVASAKNLQDLTGISALSSHVRLVEARLLLLEGRYEEAISSLNAVRIASPFASHNFNQSYVDLEIDYCRTALGRGDRESLAQRGDALLAFDKLDIDERLVAAWMLREMAGAMQLDFERSRYQSELDAIWTMYTQERQALAVTLKTLIPAEG